VAALKWNEWQLSSGFGGSFALEYAGEFTVSVECVEKLLDIRAFRIVFETVLKRCLAEGWVGLNI
jgi:hypothetical protein